MALVKKITNSRLQIHLENGLDAHGKMTFKAEVYNRINEAATDEQIQTAGAALASLQTLPVADIIRVDQTTLVNE